LVVCLLHLSLADMVWSAGTTTTPNPTLAKQRVDQFGVGANVKVELAGGKKLKGSIQSVEEGGFLLASRKADPPIRVAYEQVTQLKLAKVTYSAKGQLNAGEVKRVAAGLGVGHHIVVKTAEGKEYHGNIVALDARGFTVLPDHTTTPVQIAYNSVRQMGPNPGIGTWIGIAVLVGIVIVVTVLVVKIRND
jgi:ribosome maturation factor RimP